MLVPSKSQKESLERATSRYEQHLEAVAGYLAARGISQETASSWRLGSVVDPLPGHEHLEGRLVIPYLTRTGPVDLKFRCVQDHDCKTSGCAKYMYVAGTEHRLYNVPALLKPSDTVAICEGELDALTLDGMVGIPAVSHPGAQSWKRFWSRVFTGYRRIFVIADGDDAGVEGANEVARLVPGSTVIRMPRGHDVNSLWVEKGVEGFDFVNES